MSPKLIYNSRDNKLSPSGLLALHDFWLNQSVSSGSDVTFNSLSTTTEAHIGTNLTVDGDVTVQGAATIISTDLVEIKDNIITINSEETGSGVTANYSGIQIHRGSLIDYQFVFQESTGTFRVGQIGSLQAVATRQDSPMSNGIMTFNSVSNRIDSVSSIVIPLTFTANVTSSDTSTGTLVVTGGIGVSGDISLGKKIYVKGSSYASYIDSTVADQLHLNSGSDLILSVPDGSNVMIPANVKLTLSNGNNFVRGGVDIEIVTSGDLILTPSSNTVFPLNSKLILGDVSNYIINDNSSFTFNSTSRYAFNGSGSGLTVSANTASTSSSTGSIVATGGIGISTATNAVSSSNGGGLTVAGGTAIRKDLYVGQNVIIEGNTDSTSCTSGSLVVAGGIGSNASMNVAKLFNVSSNYNGVPGVSGAYLSIRSSTFTDNATLSNTTASVMVFNAIDVPVLASSNSSVTTTNAATFYIAGNPTAGTNQTITNSYGLWNAGASRLDGNVTIESTLNVNENSSFGKNITIARALKLGFDYTADINAGEGVYLNVANSTFTDNSTTSTLSEFYVNSIKSTTLEAANSGVVYGSVGTLVIEGAPTQGNVTITNAYALWVKNGISKFEGILALSNSTASVSSSAGNIVSAGGIAISNSTDASSSTNGGTFTTEGGMAVKKKLYVGNAMQSLNVTTVAGTSAGQTPHIQFGSASGTPKIGFGLQETESGISSGSCLGLWAYLNDGTFNVQILKAERTNGDITLFSTTNSSSSSTGSLLVQGGIGVAKNVFIGQNLNASGVSNLNQTNVDTTNGIFSVTGTHALNVRVSASSYVKTSTGSLTLQAESGSVSIDGDSSITLTSQGGINLNANAASHVSTSAGILTLSGVGLSIQGTTGSVNVETSSGISFSSQTGGITCDTTDTTLGIKIGTSNPNVPVEIGGSSSEVTIGNNLTILGNLRVKDSEISSFKTTTTIIKDNALVINSAPSGISDGGLLVKRYQIPNDLGDGEIVDGNDPVKKTGAFQAGSSGNDLVLDLSSSSIDDFYAGWWIKITSGTGINQVRRIKSYNGTTKTCTVYATADNDEDLTDGLDIVNSPDEGDTFNLYDSPYSGCFFKESSNEWVFAGVSYDISTGIMPLQTYSDLHVGGIVAERSLNVDGSSFFFDTMSISTTNASSFSVQNTNGKVFEIDSSTPSINVINPINSVASNVSLNLQQFTSTGSRQTYSQIKNVIVSNLLGSLQTNLQFNVVKNSSLITFLTFSTNSDSINFDSNVSVTKFNNTSSSTSSSTGSVQLLGGMGIDNVSDSSSSSNGGALTIAGGAAIKKNLFVGKSIHVDENLFITGNSTMNGELSVGSNFNVSSSLTGSPGITGKYLSFSSSTFQDTATSVSGTVSTMNFNAIAVPVLTAANTGVTTTNAATFYIAGGPVAGTNQTITNSYGLWNAGKTRLDGDTTINILNASDLNVSNTLTIDTNNSEAFLVRKAGDTGDVFVIDTSSSLVSSIVPTIVKTTNSAAFSVQNGSGSTIFNVNTSSNILTLTNAKLNVSGARSGTPSLTGEFLGTQSITFNDTATANSGTATSMAFNVLSAPTLTAANTSVTTTTAATFYIAGGPTAGTNETISNSYGIWNAGKTRFDGNIVSSLGAGGTNNFIFGTSSGVPLFVAGLDNSLAGSESGGDFALRRYSDAGSLVDTPFTVVRSTGFLGIGTQTINTRLTLKKNSTISIDTSDASDNGNLSITGGGIASSSRGGRIVLSGNEHLTTPGLVEIFAGNVTNGHLKMYTGNDTERVRITDTGEMIMYNTNASLSSVTGVIQLSGGIGINNTTDATSSINGGTFTTTGGLAVSKSVFIGTKLVLDFNQGYSYTGDVSGNLNVQSQVNGVSSSHRHFTFDGDNSDDNSLSIYGKGTLVSLINTESLTLGYNSTSTEYNLKTQATGTGTARPLILQVGSNTNQMKLLANGDVSFSGTITAGLITSGFSSPSTTVSNEINVSSTSYANAKLYSNGQERVLYLTFRTTPSVAHTLSSFDFILPDVSSSFSTPYDIIPTLFGFYDDTLFISVENTVVVSITGTTHARVKFTSGSISVHTLQVTIKYSII